MKAKQTSETSGTTRPTTKDQFSEDLRLQPLGCISYLWYFACQHTGCCQPL